MVVPFIIAKTDTHWDYLLKEMQWLAADFSGERKRHRAASKKLSSANPTARRRRRAAAVATIAGGRSQAAQIGGADGQFHHEKVVAKNRKGGDLPAKAESGTGAPHGHEPAAGAARPTDGTVHRVYEYVRIIMMMRRMGIMMIPQTDDDDDDVERIERALRQEERQRRAHTVGRDYARLWRQQEQKQQDDDTQQQTTTTKTTLLLFVRRKHRRVGFGCDVFVG